MTGNLKRKFKLTPDEDRRDTDVEANMAVNMRMEVETCRVLNRAIMVGYHFCFFTREEGLGLINSMPYTHIQTYHFITVNMKIYFSHSNVP